MGGSVSRILSGLLWTKKEVRILILGLVRPIRPYVMAMQFTYLTG
jgi:hypothetical protein